MNKNVRRFCRIGLISMLALSVVSCKDKDKEEENDVFTGVYVDGKLYNLAYAVDPDGQSQTYLQQVNDLTEKGADITFQGRGFALKSTRTARPYASPDGKYIYNLDYGGGAVYSHEVRGGSRYTRISHIPLGKIGTHPRWTQLDSDPGYALLHNVVSSAATIEWDVVDGDSIFKKRTVTADFVRMSTNFETGRVRQEVENRVEVILDEAADGAYISRIDAPAVVGGKAYYGFAVSWVNLEDPATNLSATTTPAAPAYDRARTLVVDYPSLTNPTIIQTDIAAGATNGFRTPCMHVDEQGDVYQIVSSSGASDLKILRISDGVYDESYQLNLSSLIGTEKMQSVGWFYVGNGIGFVPYRGATDEWSVARVDLYNNTAYRVDLPTGLWLRQYQYSKMQDGKFVMALHPKGEDGYIYFLDPAAESANAEDAVIRGAKLKNIGANECYIGVF